MEFTILHRGVPLGTAELAPADTAVGELSPAAGYTSVRPLIREASAALWALGFLSERPPATIPDPSSLARAQALSLELRDTRGAVVPVDFINIIERPDAADPPVVFCRFRHAVASVSSPMTRSEPAAPYSARPDA